MAILPVPNFIGLQAQFSSMLSLCIKDFSGNNNKCLKWYFDILLSTWLVGAHTLPAKYNNILNMEIETLTEKQNAPGQTNCQLS